MLTGAVWQRCSVHFTRNCTAKVPKASQPAISTMVRQIFNQPDRESARAQLLRTATAVEKRFAQVATMLLEAEPDILAHMDFPAAHRRQIRSTNGLERLNRELARRFEVVGIFPDEASVIRLGGTILLEQNDEWLTSRRYFSLESMASLLPNDPALPESDTSRLSDNAAD